MQQDSKMIPRILLLLRDAGAVFYSQRACGVMECPMQVSICVPRNGQSNDCGSFPVL